MYVGLLALDPTTSDLLSRDASLLTTVSADDRVAIFASFSRSIQVSDGRVVTPGNGDSVDVWQSLVGERIDAPSPFVDRLLRTDNGRLAWFYDFVHQSPAGVQAMALSTWEPDPRRRKQRVKAFYDVFYLAAEAEGFDFRNRPFARPYFDPAAIASLLRVMPDGRFPGPTSAKFWRSTLRSWDLPARVQTPPKADTPEDVLDAAALLNAIASAPTNGEWRLGRGGASAVFLAQAFMVREAGTDPYSLPTLARASVRFQPLFGPWTAWA